MVAQLAQEMPRTVRPNSPFLIWLAHELTDAYLMTDRLAASTTTYSTQAFPTQVEHPEPPLTEQDRVKLVRGIDSNDACLAHRAPTTATAASGHP
jgi:hypothetical protein